MQAVGGNMLENAQCSPETLLVTSSTLEIVIEEVCDPKVQYLEFESDNGHKVQVNEMNKDLGFPSGSTVIEVHHELNMSPQDSK